MVRGRPSPPRVAEHGAPAVGATYDAKRRHAVAAGRHRGAPGMLGTHWQRHVLVALVPFAAACGSSLKTHVPVATPASVAGTHAHADSVPTAVVAQPPAEDPVVTLIA